MKTLYIECNMGAAGDMLMAALLELIDDKDEFINTVNNLGIESVRVNAEPSVKCGILGTHVSVTINDSEEETSDDVSLADDEAHVHAYHHEHDHSHPHEHEHHDAHHHSHSSMDDIKHRLSHLNIPEKVKSDALAVYRLIAEAEAAAHGRPVEQVHFHEVGNLDAIVDIVGVCLLMERLAPDKVVVSPIHVGSGFVRCAHGVLPVPAPATAYILRSVPIYSGKIKGELCTPTGAALLKHFADEFGPMPQMSVQRIGYGMGKKDFEAANCVRAFLGDSIARLTSGGPNGLTAELRCNIDDMTGEALGYACQKLMSAGAKDVSTLPISMKKNRPAIMLTVLCNEDEADEFASMMLRYTTTYGVRKTIVSRYLLDCEIVGHETPYGAVRIKTGNGYGVVKTKFEYDDVASLAANNNLSITDMERKLWSSLNMKEC
ncbi:TIGR00299 family protein [Clostridia bacterium]|nr:TIGR00299 family protein [Clostridia bacterium]